MNLKWRVEGPFRWELGDENARFDMAYISLVEGVFHISWWVTDSENEDHKEAYFQGTVDEMKAYVFALVRLGVSE